MNLSRLFLLAVAGCCLMHPASLPAQDALGNQASFYSADMVITGKGQNTTQKIYTDNGKIRTETTLQGLQVVTIIRPDLQKVYQMLLPQKMLVEIPYDPNKYKTQTAAASGPQGKFELIGTEPVAGDPCKKYKVTSDRGKIILFWVDAATQAPVKMMAQDNSFTILWKNYEAGPQDASLFAPPTDYKVVTISSAPAAADSSVR